MRNKDLPYEPNLPSTFVEGVFVWIRREDLDFVRKSGARRAVYSLNEEATTANRARRAAELQQQREVARVRIVTLANEWLAMKGPATKAAKAVAKGVELSDTETINDNLPHLIVERTANYLVRDRGFVRTHKSGKGSGSIYLTFEVNNEFRRLRISNHHIPMTEIREYNATVGRVAMNYEIVIEEVATFSEIIKMVDEEIGY